MSKLIVVSNRVPDLDKARAGGLAVALSAVLERSGGLWFGWSGQASAETDTTPTIKDHGSFKLATIGLSEEDVSEYYQGAGNQVLWPLFHNRSDLMQVYSRYYDAYRRVNARFANCLSHLLEPDDTVWVQDFHLFPLGMELREQGFKGRIGFFLHIPFPSVDTLGNLPWAGELMSWLSRYDLVGFQTKRDKWNMTDFLTRVAGGSETDGECRLRGRRFRCGTFPVSIDTESWLELVRSDSFSRELERIRSELRPPRYPAIGVERLDYSKGLVQRVLAFEKMLVLQRRFHGAACLYQVVAPSRGDVPEFRRLKERLDSVTGRINSTYARFNWVPVRYLHRTFTHSELAALYRICRVGIVSSVIDGMNLVAKEFIVAQDSKDPGVLVLSRFTGAAEELGHHAVLVNPYDIEGTAEAICDAFDMPLGERQRRWEAMMHILEKHDVHDWATDFIETLHAEPSADN